MAITEYNSIVLGKKLDGTPVLVGLVDSGITGANGQPIYTLAVDTAITLNNATIGAVEIQDAASAAQAKVAALINIVAANNLLGTHDPATGKVGDLKADGTVIGLLNELVSNSEAVNIGVSGHNVISADASAAPIAITSVPTVGQRISVNSILISTDTNNIVVTLTEETSGTVLFTFYLATNSMPNPVNIAFTLATANKRLMLQTSKAGNIAATVLWHSVP